MVTKTYNFLTEDAKKIREKVFMEEQGFKNEFDEIDDKALHIVVYDKMMPIATCRVFESEEANTYIMGRLAVIKEYRGKHIGKGMLLKAEVMAANHNGRYLKLHAQQFYETSGYKAYGEVEDDEGCPYIWMKKALRI